MPTPTETVESLIRHYESRNIMSASQIIGDLDDVAVRLTRLAERAQERAEGLLLVPGELRNVIAELTNTLQRASEHNTRAETLTVLNPTIKP